MNRQRRKAIRADALRAASLVIERHITALDEVPYADEAELELWLQIMDGLMLRLYRESQRVA